MRRTVLATRAHPTPARSTRSTRRTSPSEFGGGLTLPAGAFCSAHWFDYHQSGIIAQGYYQAGLRLVDVRDPRHITQYGFATGGGTEVWDAYWVPERNARGQATGKKTNFVYTADAVRGIDVYQVDLPGSDLGDTGQLLPVELRSPF